MRLLDSLETYGYADLGVFDHEKSAILIAQELGRRIGVRLHAEAEQLTANATTSKPLNTYAGNYGYNTLPLHTDLAHWYIPPRYLMLRCAIGDPEVSTQLLHHRDVLDRLPVRVTERAIFRPRRRLEGKLFLMRLRHNGIFRWDQLFLTPENDEAHQVRELMIGNASSFDVTEITLDTPGRTILIDNWNALHGRSMVKQEGSSIRRIERIYFTSEGHDE